MSGLKLTFAVANYKRPEKLRVCLESICKQIIAFPEPHPACIFISDHESDKPGALVVEEIQRLYPTVDIAYSVLARKPGHGSHQNFQYTWQAPTTLWTWTFGNDDMLAPGGLAAVLDLLEQAEAQGVGFIKVAEVARASTKPFIHRDLFIQLCGAWGFIEMCGFITGNIVQTELLERAVNLPSWDRFGKCSFGHCGAFLEAFPMTRALFVDVPIIATQDLGATEDTIKMWEADQTAKRFFYVDEMLADLRERKLLPPTLPATFFRYHSYFLWDRLIDNMISQYSNHPEDSMPELWANVEGLFSFLEPEAQTVMMKHTAAIKDCIARHTEAMLKLGELSVELDNLNDRHRAEVFGFRYADDPKPYQRREGEMPVGIQGLLRIQLAAQIRQRRLDRELVFQADPRMASLLADCPLADFKGPTGKQIEEFLR